MEKTTQTMPLLQRIAKSQERERKYQGYLRALDFQGKSKDEDYQLTHGSLARTFSYVGSKLGLNTDYSRLQKEKGDIQERIERANALLRKQKEKRVPLIDATQESLSQSSGDPLLDYSIKLNRVQGALEKYKASGQDGSVCPLEYLPDRIQRDRAKASEVFDNLSPKERQMVLETIAGSEEKFNPDEFKYALAQTREIKDYNFGLPQLILVHKTSFLPHGKLVSGGSIYRHAFINPTDLDGPKICAKTTRATIHFTLNGGVNDHEVGEWSNSNYAVLIPAEEVSGRIANLLEQDTWVCGDLMLPQGSEIIISNRAKEHLTPKRLEAIKKHSGAGIITLANEGETLECAIRRRIGRRGFSYRANAKYGWEDYSGDRFLEDLRAKERIQTIARQMGISSNLHPEFHSSFGEMELAFNDLYARGKLVRDTNPEDIEMYRGMFERGFERVRQDIRRPLTLEETAELTRVKSCFKQILEEVRA